MSSMPVYTPSCGTIFRGCSTRTVSSPTVVCVRWVLSHSSKNAAPPWMGTVRSIMSLSCSNGIRSSSFLSMSSMSFAFSSSAFRLAVTFGAGILESTWASMSSAQMFRTCGVSLFLSFATIGAIVWLPMYSASRCAMRFSSSS